MKRKILKSRKVKKREESDLLEENLYLLFLYVGDLGENVFRGVNVVFWFNIEEI